MARRDLAPRNFDGSFLWGDEKMPIEYEWVPNLQTLAVADDGREFLNLINGALEWLEEQPWWNKVGLQTEILNRRQCRELWQWLGRTDKVPKSLRIFVNRKDMERIWPGIMDE
jgi:hypothetical protein